MAEESEISGSGKAGDSAAISLALGVAAQNERVAAKAEAYLEKQGRLADLQIEDMERDLSLRHWSLRFGNVSAVMKVSFEIGLAFVMLAIVSVIVLAIWTAAHDDGLVIEAFDVPQDMAAKGLSGQVIATQVQDRIAFIQSHADTLRAANTFRNNWGNDIKVQIPDTGVSVGEAYRFLANWVGHETHITGEVWRDTKGIALSARAGNASAQIFRGSESDLDSLVTKAAEYVFWQTQPYRYTVFLDQQGRNAEALAYTKELALNGSSIDQAWAYSRWGTELDTLGDFKNELDKQEHAIALAPDLPHVNGNLAAIEDELGHDEAGLRDNARSLALMQGGGSRNYASYAVPVFRITQAVLIAEQKGDFGEAVSRGAEALALPDYNAAHFGLPIEASADLARLHDVAASLKADPEAPNEEAGEFRMMQSGNFPWDLPPLPAVLRNQAIDDWSAVRDDLIALAKLPIASDPHAKALQPFLMWPWLAYAHARTGDERAAETLIAKTPLDCLSLLAHAWQHRSGAESLVASGQLVCRRSEAGAVYSLRLHRLGRNVAARGQV
jgi:tetratricopeptide (TPR) repeat protein